MTKKTIADYYALNTKEVKLSWQQIEKDTLSIVHKMHTDDFVPDMIISLARSGLIPASLISYCLSNKNLYVIKADLTKTQSSGKTQDLRTRPVLTQRIKRSLKGLKILVVDEMTVSGETLKLVSSYLKTKKPKDVRFAVLYKQPWTQFKPDYFGKEISYWPIYPWRELGNVYRDPRDVVKKNKRSA